MSLFIFLSVERVFKREFDENRRGWERKSRLQALESYGILDTPREELFDNIAELAAEICGTPIGVVNFISDTRQFYKAERAWASDRRRLKHRFVLKQFSKQIF